jgi:ABC-type transporter Mla subunit MlaD
VYLALVKVGTGAATETGRLLADTRETLQSTNALIKDAKDSLDDTYWDVKATIETVATTAKDTDDFVKDLHRQTSDTLTEARGLLSDSRSLVTSMQSDMGRLTDSTDAALKPLATTLERIAQLSATLDTEAKRGGIAVNNVALELQSALDDLDNLITDPSIQKILTNSTDTSKYLAESAESIDTALRPWRKKAGQLKMIVEKALGLIKLTFPL